MAELLNVATSSGLEATAEERCQEKWQYLIETGEYDVTNHPQIFAFPYKQVGIS